MTRHSILLRVNSLYLAYAVFVAVYTTASASYPQRVLLRDVSVITLYKDKWTTARRNRAIPQLKCIGGSAGCSAFVPDVVQCYNRGTDGIDVQWECKTDMDKAYKFGRIEVVCEGYDFPDDPYILAGSCGLEYTLEKTGYGHHGHHDSGYFSRHSSKHDGNSSKFSSLFGLLILAAIAYGIYYLFLKQPANPPPYPEADPRGPPPPYGFNATAPPPPGFRPEYTDGCNTNTASDGWFSGRPGGSSGNGGGGFWSGAGVGGLVGYLFGSARQRQQAPYPTNGGSFFGTGRSSGWGGFSGSRHSSSSSSSSSSSGGTRTTSGFGGTRRR